MATLAPALDHVTVACILLGSAAGSPEQLVALHGTRLDMLISRMLDTTVRGIVYEGSGTVEDHVLREGARHVLAACEASMIPCALLEADPADHVAGSAMRTERSTVCSEAKLEKTHKS